MYPAFTVFASLGAVLAMLAFCLAAGTDVGSTQFFVFWTAAPYLGYCALAFARRRRPTASAVVFFGTALSAALATFLYWKDIRPVITAHIHGVRPPMNCAGPLIELGFPILQWLFVGVPCLITWRRQSAELSN